MDRPGIDVTEPGLRGAGWARLQFAVSVATEPLVLLCLVQLTMLAWRLPLLDRLPGWVFATHAKSIGAAFYGVLAAIPVCGARRGLGSARPQRACRYVPDAWWIRLPARARVERGARPRGRARSDRPFRPRRVRRSGRLPAEHVVGDDPLRAEGSGRRARTLRAFQASGHAAHLHGHRAGLEDVRRVRQ